MIKSSKLVNLVLVSSTVLGMVVTAGTSTAMAAAKTSADTSSVMTKKDNSPRIDYQTSGTLAASGTAMDGLELIAGNQVTRGTLHMKYDVKSFATLNWQEHTVTTIKLPREFNAFAKDGSLLKYIASANFNYTSSINTINHSYTSNEMHIEKDTQSDDTYLLKFDNPTVTGIGLNVQMHVEFDLNLGDMVTDTGVRIPDAYDKSAYHLASTITDKDDAGIIDWHLVGNTNGATTIPIWQLDPGYDILKQAPTIHNPIYDTDTVVTGSGIPGAKITLRQGVQPDSPIIGTGEVDASGVYSITIPAHNAGVTISATQNAWVW
ncbi:Ig-like domain-containing protein [Latilactobacillus sakei]